MQLENEITQERTAISNGTEAVLPDARPVPYLRIEPSKGWTSLRLDELWAYRELLYFLTWRDIKIRYKQTILGALWAVIQPFFTMIVFSLFFGKLAKIPSDNIPYPIFSYAALVPWTFFASRLTSASTSLVSGSRLLKKIYFPRMSLPLAAVLGGLVDFTIAFLVLIGMMLYYRIYPTINIVWVPFFVLLIVITALGTSLWLSAMNVQFRDVQYMVPFITQFWMFITPVTYPTSLIKDPLLQAVYALNPMVGVIDGFRWALLGTDTAPGPIIIISTVTSLLILVSGAFYFRRMEKTFADVV